MAIYGSLGEVNVGALSASISDTAVDVFVYDTRKDSDGGAWRKRTQHTSWYNETLNTATRGSRREFPAVAVIVATVDKVTIYDGDDPDLPMWMVFSSGGSRSYHYYPVAGIAGGTTFAYNGAYTNGPSSVKMINGKFLFTLSYLGDNRWSGLYRIDFISESTTLINGGGYSSGTWIRKHNISERNTFYEPAYSISYDQNFIVNAEANDVAMTVLPNAPIDPATGLPIPTIIVGTDGNGTYLTSVISDQGTIYNIGTDGGYTCTSISIGSDNSLSMVRSDGTVYVWNDISKISASGISPDTTLTGLLGTVSSVETT